MISMLMGEKGYITQMIFSYSSALIKFVAAFLSLYHGSFQKRSGEGKICLWALNAALLLGAMLNSYDGDHNGKQYKAGET